MRVLSFGYKFQAKPRGAFVLDARVITNPYKHGEPDEVMRNRALDTAEAHQLVERGVAWLREHPEGTLAVGCSYGRHRSVAVANEIARRVGVAAEHLSPGSNGRRLA